jgi:hypothetical protein
VAAAWLQLTSWCHGGAAAPPSCHHYHPPAALSVVVQADMELMDMAERDVLPAMLEVRGSG